MFKKITIIATLFLITLLIFTYWTPKNSSKEPLFQYIASGHMGRSGSHRSSHKSSSHRGTTHKSSAHHVSPRVHQGSSLQHHIPQAVPQIHHMPSAQGIQVDQEPGPYIYQNPIAPNPGPVYAGTPYIDQPAPQTYFENMPPQEYPPPPGEEPPPPEIVIPGNKPSDPNIYIIRTEKLTPKQKKALEKTLNVQLGRIPEDVQKALRAYCEKKYSDPNEKDPFMRQMNMYLTLTCFGEMGNKYLQMKDQQKQNEPSTEPSPSPEASPSPIPPPV